MHFYQRFAMNWGRRPEILIINFVQLVRPKLPFHTSCTLLSGSGASTTRSGWGNNQSHEVHPPNRTPAFACRWTKYMIPNTWMNWFGIYCITCLGNHIHHHHSGRRRIEPTGVAKGSLQMNFLEKLGILSQPGRWCFFCSLGYSKHIIFSWKSPIFFGWKGLGLGHPPPPSFGYCLKFIPSLTAFFSPIF